MKRILLLFTLILFSYSASGKITTERHTIEISTSQKGLLVEENILINNTNSKVRFWIQQDAKNVKIVDSAGETLSPLIYGNVYECNSSQQDFRVTYTISAEYFEKTLLYDTTFLSITFNGKELYRGENLLHRSNLSTYLRLLLYRPTEAPLTIAYLVAIFVGVVIAIVGTLMFLRKQRLKTIDSEEVLSTKKALLLSILKDIEKRYRSKSISDETYNKLKEEYKREAVEVMKKIEDMKS
jgi:hypothetical protein